MVRISQETVNILPSLSQPMRLVVDMSSLDLALVAIMMCLFRFLRHRYESHTVESIRVEPQQVESKSQDPPPIPPFKLYVTPPSTPVKEHPNRDSADISSSETAVSHRVETEKGAPSSSSRSFPLDRQSSKKAQGAAAPPSPPPSASSKKSIKSSASTKSDTAGEPIKRRSTQEDSAFNSFKRLCDAHGLLKRPTGLSEHDVVDGINDEATLLYVRILTALESIPLGLECSKLTRAPGASSMLSNATFRWPTGSSRRPPSPARSTNSAPFSKTSTCMPMKRQETS